MTTNATKGSIVNLFKTDWAEVAGPDGTSLFLAKILKTGTQEKIEDAAKANDAFVPTLNELQAVRESYLSGHTKGMNCWVKTSAGIEVAHISPNPDENGDYIAIFNETAKVGKPGKFIIDRDASINSTNPDARMLSQATAILIGIKDFQRNRGCAA